MILIGSSAIKHYFPDFPREPKDRDYIIFEYQHFDIMTNYKTEYFKNKVISDLYVNNNQEQVIELNHLYTLKISHSLWDLENGSWSKHMWDIQWLRDRCCVLDIDLFYKLYQHWEKVHGKRKTSNLNMTADKFFDNAIKCPIDHDTLHEYLIQHNFFNGQLEPTYKKVLADNQEVLPDESKFNLLSEDEKLKLTFEEVCVMAYERAGSTDYRIAFHKMLKKFITSHASVWQAVHIIQNHRTLLRYLTFNYIEHLNNYAH